MLHVPPTTLRERKKAATKERIFYEALNLFRQKGFMAATVEEIAEAAEVSKGTFFNYFRSKEALLNYLGERQTVAVADEVRETLLDPALGARQKLVRILRRLASNVEADRDLTRLAVFEAMKVPDALAADPYRRLFRETLVALLREGQGRGEVRTDLDAEVGGSAIMGMYMQQIFEWCSAPMPFPLAERLAAMVEVLWGGIGAEGSGNSGK